MLLVPELCTSRHKEARYRYLFIYNTRLYSYVTSAISIDSNSTESPLHHSELDNLHTRVYFETTHSVCTNSVALQFMYRMRMFRRSNAREKVDYQPTIINSGSTMPIDFTTGHASRVSQTVKSESGTRWHALWIYIIPGHIMGKLRRQLFYRMILH
jgi:hypothetical protein